MRNFSDGVQAIKIARFLVFKIFFTNDLKIAYGCVYIKIRQGSREVGWCEIFERVPTADRSKLKLPIDMELTDIRKK